MSRPLKHPRSLAGKTFGGWRVTGQPETPDPLYPRRIAYQCTCVGCNRTHLVWRDNVLARQVGCRSCAAKASRARTLKAKKEEKAA